MTIVEEFLDSKKLKKIFNFEKRFDKNNKDGVSVNFQGLAANSMIKKYGCYLYALLNGSNEDPKNIEKWYDRFKTTGKINSECLIKDPAGIVGDITGQRWTFRKSNQYDPKADIAIARFNNGYQDHFVQMDGPDKKDVSFDSYGKSRTVATGEIKDWRLLYKV